MRRPGNKAKSGSEIFEVLWDVKALQAVEKIYNYILQKSFQGAEKVREEIFDAVESFKQNPERFSVDRDLKSPYRRCLVRNYRIIFRIYPEKCQVLVVHVWNSKRSIQSLLKEMGVQR